MFRHFITILVLVTFSIVSLSFDDSDIVQLEALTNNTEETKEEMIPELLKLIAPIREKCWLFGGWFERSEAKFKVREINHHEFRYSVKGTIYTSCDYDY